MSSKHPDNDIDRIFKSALDSEKTEPSDTFWTKSYEEIIQRENRIYNKQVRRWKAVAYTLAVALVVIAFYMFYVHGRINGIQNQLTQFEQKEAMPVAVTKPVTGTTTAIPSAAEKTTAITNTVTTNNKAVLPAAAGQHTIPAAGNTLTAYNRAVTVTTNSHSKNAGSNTSYSNPGSINVGANTSSSNKNPNGFGGNKLPGSYYGSAANTGGTLPAATSNTETQAAVSPPHTDSVAVATKQNATPAAIKPVDTTLQAKTTVPPDTASPVIRTSAMLASKSVLKNSYISAFFSPELSDERITNNTTYSSAAGAVKEREDDGFTYTAGINAGYDLSKRLSVFTGLYYHSYSFTIMPNEVQASWYNSQAGYLMVTSAGTLNLPCKGYQITGDSIKASGHTTMAYISIPLQLRYNLTGTKHIGLYIDAGVTANILMHNSAYTYWQYWQTNSSAMQEGSATLQACQGLEQSFYAYNAGIGITYKLSNGLSIFGEPSFQGAFTPENKSTAITTYPYLFGLELGATYHF